jgi:trigger factor
MQHTLKKLENSRVEVMMTFSQEEWSKALKNAFAKLAKDIKIDGFRPGKAPEAMLKARINPSKWYDTAINDVLPGAYNIVIKEENLTPLSRPQIDVTKVSDTELELKAIVILVPEVTLKSYKNLPVKREPVTVTDEEITQDMDAAIKNHAELVLKDEPAALGDTVVFDFEGFVNDVAFEGGKADNYALELGSGQFIPGFEDQMVGLKAGDAKDLGVTFPENYNAELAGKPAIFKIKVHEVKGKKLPEMNEDLFKDMNLKGVKNVDQFKEYTKQKLTSTKQKQGDDKFYSDLLMHIAKEATIDVPHEAIHEQMHAMEEDLVGKLKQRNQTKEQYIQALGQTEQQFHDTLHQQAEDILRASLVANKIAQEESIEVSDELVDFEIAKLAEQYKMEFEKVKDILKPNLARFRSDIRDRYIKEFLIKNNS